MPPKQFWGNVVIGKIVPEAKLELPKAETESWLGKEPEEYHSKEKCEMEEY